LFVGRCRERLRMACPSKTAWLLIDPWHFSMKIVNTTLSASSVFLPIFLFHRGVLLLHHFAEVEGKSLSRLSWVCTLKQPGAAQQLSMFVIRTGLQGPQGRTRGVRKIVNRVSSRLNLLENQTGCHDAHLMQPAVFVAACERSQKADAVAHNSRGEVALL